MARDSELERLRTIISGEWEAQKYAKKQMDDAWNELQRLQDRNGPQIKSLKEQHDRMYEEMGAAFRDASNAFSSGDHEDAKRYSARGREIQAEMRELPPRRRRLIDEIEPARKRWSAARDVYLDKKHVFRLAKERFDDRKRQLSTERRDVAVKAGTPRQYWDDVKVVEEASGSTSVYFGGTGKPDGPGHAHYVVDRFGNLTWRREPNESRGRHNAR
jgi:hypothetical protein